MTKLGILAAAALTAASLTPHAFGAAGHARPHTDPDPARARLVGWSMLPTQTYVPGSAPSGHWTTGNTAVPAPYPGQPVQGFSAIHALADGSLPGDERQRLRRQGQQRRLRARGAPDPPERRRPAATAYEGSAFRLSDPDRHIPWTIWRDGGCAATASAARGYACPAPDRVLTGWDFDMESMQIATDGTFWFGEEFGPFLLHTNAQGELLEAPDPHARRDVALEPDARRVRRRTWPTARATRAWRSRPNGRMLYPMLGGRHRRGPGRRPGRRPADLHGGARGVRRRASSATGWSPRHTPSATSSWSTTTRRW